MIEPFVDTQVNSGVISYGLSSYGYDIRVGNKFKVFTNVHSAVVDPKNFDPRSFVDVEVDVGHTVNAYCLIPPNSFALASSIEYFRIPRNILTICLGKSTYARCGIIVNVTPFEPEWEGRVTLEISNTTPLPAKIYANEGLAQVLFLESDEECEVSYKDKKGKYQGQIGITLPTIEKVQRGPCSYSDECSGPTCPCKKVRELCPVNLCAGGIHRWHYSDGTVVDFPKVGTKCDCGAIRYGVHQHY